MIRMIILIWVRMIRMIILMVRMIILMGQDDGSWFMAHGSRLMAGGGAIRAQARGAGPDRPPPSHEPGAMGHEP